MAGATMPLYKAAGPQDAGSGRHACLGFGACAFSAASSARLSAACTSGISVCESIIAPHAENTGINEESDVSPWKLVQASAGVPPQVESISPTVTFCFSEIARPKKYATAEKVAAVCGVHVVQVSW